MKQVKRQNQSHPLRDQIQEVFPSIGTSQSAELSKVIVAGETVISVSLNVDGSQVTAEWHTTSEQEMLNLNIEVDVGELLRLCGHSATQEIVVVTRLDDDGPVEPVAQAE